MAGVYIHIPFCKQKCSYCDFHFSTSLAKMDDMIRAICHEISQAPEFIGHSKKINSIYFGGGTPSLLNQTHLILLFDAINKKFYVESATEITLECNPDDIKPNTLKQWLDLGINRLSLGVQSIFDSELIWMNRAHRAEASIESIRLIKDIGFRNFSIDLIFGSSFLTDDMLKETLDQLVPMQIPHFSCYGLTVEPKTVLAHRITKHQIPAINTELQARQFLLISDRLFGVGYDHYEISNYALPGYRSRHNSSYWNSEPYWGFGPSAHGFDGSKTRYWNIANNTGYIDGILKGVSVKEIEVLTDLQQLNEQIMIQLRTSKGIDLNRIECDFSVEFRKAIEMDSIPYLQSGKMNRLNNRLFLTDTGKLFADGIASALFRT